MKIRVLIQVILTTLAIHSTGYAGSNDKTLWRQAEYGMTPAQVLKVFPHAQKNPNPDRVSLTMSYSHVIIPSTRISSIDFEVSFFFNATGLVQVTLIAERTINEYSKQLVSLLNQKYGKPIEIDGNSCYDRVEWYADQLSISIFNEYSPCYDNSSVSIYYGHSRYDAMNSL